jgi:hypothetical protein
LPPTFVGSVSGFEVRQPYYFDIVESRRHLVPAVMTKRH